jgi:uncharacterized membrane protein YidH (DUF202 family)
MEARELTSVRFQMKISEVALSLLLIGFGIYLLRFCSGRFMMLRRSRSFTPYLYGIGGILSLMLITFAAIVAFLVLLGPMH